MWVGAAGLLLGVLAAAGRAAPAMKTMQFQMSTVTDAKGMHVDVEGKVWVKGQKARLETSPPMSGPMIILVDGTRVRTLYPQQRRGTVATVPGGKTAPRSPWEVILANVNGLTHGARKLSPENLDGYACDVYQLTRSRGGERMTVKSWITRGTQPRIPLKVENRVEMHRPNMSMSQTQTVRITGLRFGVPIPDSVFAVPAGYKIVEAGPPGAPGMPGPPGMGGPGFRP
jgi:outer membrane lipoprotein-sorting protein